MTSDAVKIERIKRAAERERLAYQAITDIARVAQAVLDNPVIELAGGLTALELLYRYPKERPIIGDWTSYQLAKVGLGTILSYKALAPLLPVVSSGISDVLKALPAAALK